MKKLMLIVAVVGLAPITLQAGKQPTEFVIYNNLPKENKDEFVILLINHQEKNCDQARTVVSQGSFKKISSGTYKKFGVITTPCCIKSIEVRIQDMSIDPKTKSPRGKVTSIFEMSGEKLDAKLQDIGFKSLTKGNNTRMRSYGDKNSKGSCGDAHVELEVEGLYNVEIL